MGLHNWNIPDILVGHQQPKNAIMQMTERQRKFREEYKSQISPLYNGLLHISVLYAAGAYGIWWCLSQLQNARWEWLLVAPGVS